MVACSDQGGRLASFATTHFAARMIWPRAKIREEEQPSLATTQWDMGRKPTLSRTTHFAGRMIFAACRDQGRRKPSFATDHLAGYGNLCWEEKLSWGKNPPRREDNLVSFAKNPRRRDDDWGAWREQGGRKPPLSRKPHVDRDRKSVV